MRDIIDLVIQFWPWFFGGGTLIATLGALLVSPLGSAVLAFFLGTKVGRWLVFGFAVAGALAWSLAKAFLAGRARERAANNAARGRTAVDRIERDGSIFGRLSFEDRKKSIDPAWFNR